MLLSCVVVVQFNENTLVQGNVLPPQFVSRLPALVSNWLDGVVGFVMPPVGLELSYAGAGHVSSGRNELESLFTPVFHSAAGGGSTEPDSTEPSSTEPSSTEPSSTEPSSTEPSSKTTVPPQVKTTFFAIVTPAPQALQVIPGDGAFNVDDPREEYDWDEYDNDRGNDTDIIPGNITTDNL